MVKKGLFIIYTGNGKGKTTAALGQALRAAGHGFKVCIIQFIKNKKDTGEAKALKNLPESIELHTTGSGFTWKAKDRAELEEAARLGWELAKEKIASRTYHMIILDELTYLLSHKLITEDEIYTVIDHRPPGQHLIITGRDADPQLIARADLVTEMQEVKHPFKNGIKAQKGIEY